MRQLKPSSKGSRKLSRWWPNLRKPWTTPSSTLDICVCFRCAASCQLMTHEATRQRLAVVSQLSKVRLLQGLRRRDLCAPKCSHHLTQKCILAGCSIAFLDCGEQEDQHRVQRGVRGVRPTSASRPCLKLLWGAVRVPRAKSPAAWRPDLRAFHASSFGVFRAVRAPGSRAGYCGWGSARGQQL